MSRTLRGLLLPVLALLTAFVVGAFVIILTDFELLGLWASDPVAAVGASWSAVMATYGALLRGSIGDPARLISALAGTRRLEAHDARSGRSRRRSSRRRRSS